MESSVDVGYLHNLLLLIVPLTMFILITPLAAIYLDYRDYKTIEHDGFNISDSFLETFALKT